METIVTIFTVLSMYMTSIGHVNSEYFYNADIEDGIVTNLYVYLQGAQGLEPKAMNHFEYDAQGRLSEKVVSRWNIWEKSFQPSYKYQLVYSQDGYELALSTWNIQKKSWNPAVEKAIYHFEDGQLTSTNYLERNRRGEYRPTDGIRVLHASESLLLAQE